MDHNYNINLKSSSAAATASGADHTSNKKRVAHLPIILSTSSENLTPIEDLPYDARYYGKTPFKTEASVSLKSDPLVGDPAVLSKCAHCLHLANIMSMLRSRPAVSEANLSGCQPVRMPWGGIITTRTSAGDIVSNVSLMNNRMYLAKDHPWSIRDPSATGVSQVLLHTPSGPMKFQVEQSSVDRDTSGFANIQVAGAGVHAPLIYPETGMLVSIAPYRGNVRVQSTGVVGVPVAAQFETATGPLILPCFSYDCDSQSGDCGSAVISNHGIVGTHIGFDAETGTNLFAPFESHRYSTESLPLRRGVFQSNRVSYTIAQTPSVPALPVLRATRRLPSTPVLEARGRTARRPRSRSLRGRSSSKSKSRARSSSQRSNRRQVVTVVRRPRSEALVSMDPAPSDYLGTTSGVSHPGRAAIVDRYLQQLINPWSMVRQRLPDDNLRPTSLASFFANRTYTVANSAVDGYNMMFGMNSRQSTYATTPPSAPSEPQTTVSSGTPYFNTYFARQYAYSPGSILPPLQFTSTLGDNTTAGQGASPWNDDFGTEQIVTNSWITAYRTLAMAIRLRVIGLPTGQFMAPGKVYVAQVNWNNADLPQTEQDFVNLERVNQASHVSLDAVREAGSKTFYALPDGANKFEFSSDFWPAPGLFGNTRLGVSNNTQVPSNMFPRVGTASTGLTAYLGTVLLPDAVIPYVANTTNLESYPGGVGVSDTPYAVNADGTMVLLVAIFGQNDGLVIEADYAKIVEYIPTPNAPPGVETAVQLRDSLAMDHIFSAASIVAAARNAMFQAPGDKTLSSGAASSESKRVVNRIARMVTESHRQGRPLSRTEGFWDFSWLSRGDLGEPGKGLSWNFSGDKSGRNQRQYGRSDRN